MRIRPGFSKSGGGGSAAPTSASLGNLSELQSLGLIGPTDTLGVGPAVCVLTIPLSNSHAPSGLRTTGLMSSNTKIKCKVLKKLRLPINRSAQFLILEDNLIFYIADSNISIWRKRLQRHLLTNLYTFKT